jgi:ribosomal protein L27
MTVRTKKVKSGASATNRRRTTPGKYRRLYVKDGEWVEEDHLLVRQLGLQFYPGENVKLIKIHLKT